MPTNPLRGWRGLALTLTGWAVQTYCVLRLTGVILRLVWRHWTGQLPQRRDDAR